MRLKISGWEYAAWVFSLIFTCLPDVTTNHHDSCSMTSSHCTVIAKAICSPLICYRELQQVGNVNIGLGWKSCTQLYCPTLPSCEFFQHRQHSHPISRASVFHSTQDYTFGIGTSELTGHGPEIIIRQVWQKLRRWGYVQVVDKNFMGTYKCELLGALRAHGDHWI